MTTEELLALRKEKEAQVAGMSIEQVINGLKNDDPLYGLIARLYVARCMEWATEVAGDASKIPEQVQKAVEAAVNAAKQAGISEDWAKQALQAAENLGAMEEEGKLLLKLLEDTKMSDNKAAYLAFLSRAAVPSVFKLMTNNGVFVMQPDELHVFKEYDKQEYNAALSPVKMQVDADGIITFSDDCELLISARSGFGLGTTMTSRVNTIIDYYDAKTDTWPDLVSANNYHVGAGGVSQAIPSVYYSYKKGTKLRYVAQNWSEYSVFAGGKGNVCFVQFMVLPDVSRFPTTEKPTIIDTGEIDEIVQSVGTASEAAGQASTAAETAQTAAESLSQAASHAQAAAESAAESEKSSESWAVGGTGTRTGENIDNAKYWSEQAQFAAGGGVTSFKGRAGIVNPQSGDYTPEQVGADAKGSAQAALGEAKAYTDNLKSDLQGTVESLVEEKASTADIMQGVPQLYGKPQTAKPRDILSELAGAALFTKTPLYQPVSRRLSDTAVGDVVYLKEGGVMAPFYVAQTDYESGLNGTGNVLLVRKDIHSLKAWQAAGTNTYASSDMDTWLNGEYRNALAGEIQAAMKDTAFRYTVGGGDTTVATLQRKVFLLSLTELGLTYSYANVEGSALPSTDILKIAYLDGVATTQLTRSPRYNNASIVCVATAAGGSSTLNVTNASGGVRPAFVLPRSITLSWYEGPKGVYETQDYANGLTDVKQSAVHQLGGYARIETGSYKGTGTAGVAAPNKLTFGFEPKLVFIRCAGSQIYQTCAMNGALYSEIYSGSSAIPIVWSWEGNSVTYYSTSGVQYQLNAASTEYVYVAIG